MDQQDPSQEPTPAATFLDVAYNIHGCAGWPKTRKNTWRVEAARPRMPERLAVELALCGVDLVSFSEAPAEAEVRRIAATLGMSYAYFSGGFSGAILTRHRIVEHANFSHQSEEVADEEPFSRHWGRALIEAGGVTFPVHSVHLNPHKQEMRLREIGLVLERVKADTDAYPGVLVQGDLNHKPDQPEHARWQDAGLVDTFAAKGQGVDGTATSMTPRMRIDYIWAHGLFAE
ncbi:MAG TPA: endonuclease/exonuclease/phosphatase family protein, partial [Candidatus Hydrogenedentes bacterium]|nr:endonuclease/exonuclease/phosphatase family protein [Candidatus Hydrogenedentota bacterium]